MLRRGLLTAAVLLAGGAAPAAAVPPAPIPEGPRAGSLTAFVGAPAPQRPVAAADPPRHPFMAPNSRSNIHVDAYQTDVHQAPGPLGIDMSRVETFLSADCSTQDGKTTAPGLERVDLDADGSGCRSVWRSQEIAPTVVPKLSAANGIVYTYTKGPQPDGQDAWYLTALDFHTGKTLYKRLGGEGRATTTTTRRSRSAPTAPPTSACSAA